MGRYCDEVSSNTSSGPLVLIWDDWSIVLCRWIRIAQELEEEWQEYRRIWGEAHEGKYSVSQASSGKWTVDRTMSVWVKRVYMECLIAGCRCGWSVFRWLRSGECSGWWLRWLRQCGIPDITPSSRGGSWRPRAATGAATASGCGTIRMETMEFSQQCGIEYVVPGHPGSLFRPVSLPINEVFQPATPSPRIQNVLDLVDGGLVQDFWRRRCLRLGGSWCRWRKWFKEGNMKGRVNSVPGRKL